MKQYYAKNYAMYKIYYIFLGNGKRKIVEILVNYVPGISEIKALYISNINIFLVMQIY